MTGLIETLRTFALAAGFWGIVFAGFLPEIFPPLASTAVAMGLGFFLFAGQPTTTSTVWQLFLHIGLPVSIGLTIGAVIIYFIVLKAGIAIVDRWGKWIGVSRDDVDRLAARMKGTSTDDLALFVARSFPLMPSVVVNLAAGILRTRMSSFIILTFTGTIVRTMWSAYLGWQIGSAFERYAATIEHINALLTVVAVLGLAGWIFYHHRKTKLSQP